MQALEQAEHALFPFARDEDEPTDASCVDCTRPVKVFDNWFPFHGPKECLPRHPLDVLTARYGTIYDVPVAALRGCADSLDDGVENLDAWLAEAYIVPA